MVKVNKILCFIMILLLHNSLYATDFKVLFENNDFFSDDELLIQVGEIDKLKEMKSNRIGFFMKLSRTSLELLYNQEGFFNATVSLKDSLDVENETKTYTFTITEGKRFKFNNVTLKIPEWSKILVESSELSTNDKNYYSLKDISKDQKKLRSVYWENGFLHVKVNYKIKLIPEKSLVDLKFYIDPKAQAKMGDFHATTGRLKRGKTNFQDTTLQKEKPGLSDLDYLTSLWTISKNQVIDGNYFVAFRSKLYATRLFSQVNLKDSLNQETGLVDIYLSTIERVPGKTQFSYFYEPTYGNGVSAYSQHKNIGGRLHELNGLTMVAQRKQELSLGYANPMLFGTSIRSIPTPIRLDARIITLHEELPLISYSDSLEERYEIANENDISFGLNRFMKFRFSTDLRQVNNITTNDRFLKLKFDTGLDINLTNSFVSPTKGIRLIPSIGNGGTITKENNFTEKRYWYAQILTKYYIPATSWLNLAFAYDYGKFFQKAIEDDAKMFYLGGSRSVRGYKMYSIYPSKEEEDPDDPDETITESGLTPTYHRFSQELRFKLPGNTLRNFRLVEFSDWAWVKDADTSYKNTSEAALGLGLRFHWEVLTIRLDYTFKKDLKDPWSWEEFEWGRISFDLSQAI